MDTLHSTLEPDTLRWRRLAACIIAMMAVANLQYAWTLFTIPLTEALHATLSAVQIAFTLFILTETWLVPFEGWLVDRLGARGVVSAGGLLVGISWLGAGLANSLTGLYVFYAIGGLGAGAVYGACVGTALKWFPDRRGLAAGLTAGAYGAGTALTVLPIQWMIRATGYRTAFLAWGIVQGLCVMAAAQFLRAPSASWPPPGSRAQTPLRVAQSPLSHHPLEMVRTRPFWMMYLMMALVAFGGLTVTAQLKPIAHAYGLDRGVLFLAMSALSLALILDRVLKKMQDNLRKQGERKVYGLGFQVTSNGVDPANLFNAFLIAHGGQDIVIQDSKLHLDDPKVKAAAIKAVAYLGGAYRDGYVPPSAINWNDADDRHVSNYRDAILTTDRVSSHQKGASASVWEMRQRQT
jgi:MFS family permease